MVAGMRSKEVGRPRREELLSPFLSLRGQVVLPSLENRFPVVGFSASFVRTGGGLPSDESPRKVRVVADPQVSRLLGLRPAVRGENESGIVVIE